MHSSNLGEKDGIRENKEDSKFLFSIFSQDIIISSRVMLPLIMQYCCVVERCAEEDKEEEEEEGIIVCWMK